MPSPRDFMLSQSATDLGLGGQVRSQLDAQEEERKKRLLAKQRAQALEAGGSGLGPATMALYGSPGGFSV